MHNPQGEPIRSLDEFTPEFPSGAFQHLLENFGSGQQAAVEETSATPQSRITRYYCWQDNDAICHFSHHAPAGVKVTVDTTAAVNVIKFPGLESPGSAENSTLDAAAGSDFQFNFPLVLLLLP